MLYSLLDSCLNINGVSNVKNLFIGMEKEEKYFNISQQRIAKILTSMS